MSVGIVGQGTATGKQFLAVTDVGKPRFYDLPEGIKPRINLVKSFCHILCPDVTVNIKIGFYYF